MVYVKQHLSKNNRWRPAALLTLMAAILFPYGWLAATWPTFDWLTGLIFGSEAAHIAGHVGLFMLLGTAVLTIFTRLRMQPMVYFGLITCLGVMQELLQLTTFKHRPVGASDLFDLAVDLLAAGVVFAMWPRPCATTRGYDDTL